MRDCAFRDTDTHRHTQYTGTQGHPIPPFVLRLIVYTAQIILRTGCICSSGYFRLFCSARANLQRTRSREFAQSLFPVCIFYWPQFASFHALFESQKRRVACCVSRTIFGWLESRKGGFSRCSPCT